MTVPTPEGVTTRPIGLDYTAVMLTGQALDVDMAMVAEILPRIEAAIINPSEGMEEEAGDDD